MEEKYLKKVNTSSIKKYKKPFLITFSGVPGSGKTLGSQEISKELQIFLLSNDYIRNYYYQQTTDYSAEKRHEIDIKVIKINFERLLKLLLSHKSFVMDRNFNSEKSYKPFTMISKICGYQLVKIKLNSLDIENIKRISKREINYNKKVEGVIGDNVNYSTSYGTEEYQNNLYRKPITISDKAVDYTIENNGSKEEYKKKLLLVIDDLKRKNTR